jgi:hypothetical protein
MQYLLFRFPRLTASTGTGKNGSDVIVNVRPFFFSLQESIFY